MSAPRIAVRLAALVSLVMLGALPAQAQFFGTPSWRVGGLGDDTLHVGFLDSTHVVDMGNYRTAVIRFEVDPPSGAAEPWFLVAIRAVGSMQPRPDSVWSAAMQLQPVVDHSYFASAAGDSMAFGHWTTANAVTLGNGEVLFRGARSNSKWPYPDAVFLTLTNKGNEVPVRYWYLQVRGLSGSGVFCRWNAQYQLRN